jgi:hypothetical protein
MTADPFRKWRVERADAVAADTPCDTSPRESVAAARQSRRKAMLEEFDRLEQLGRGRPSVPRLHLKAQIAAS